VQSVLSFAWRGCLTATYQLQMFCSVDWDYCSLVYLTAPFSAAQVTWRWTTWEDDYELYVGKDLKSSVSACFKVLLKILRKTTRQLKQDSQHREPTRCKCRQGSARLSDMWGTGKRWPEAAVNSLKVSPRHSHGLSKASETLVSRAGAPAEIRTGYLSEISQASHRWVPLSVCFISEIT